MQILDRALSILIIDRGDYIFYKVLQASSFICIIECLAKISQKRLIQSGIVSDNSFHRQADSVKQ